MATTSGAVTTVKSQALSVTSSASTPSKFPGKRSEPSASSTSTDARQSGSGGIGNGRKEAYDAGLKRALAGYINSPLMEQISMELTVNRIAVEAMSQAAEQRERLLSHWRAEAAWWRAEHGKVSAEYSEFVKAVSRMVK